jgi:DUF1365 family protein
MTSASCLYEGVLWHSRFEPRHRFRHRLVLTYIDLEELPELLGGRLTRAAPGPMRFRRRDYLGDPRVPLAESVRDLVEQRTGCRPAGPVRLLTQLRSFGHCFNPVSFYYCLGERTEDVEAVVAEVTNTPWGERHAYVIPHGQGRMGKALHVSPFMGMDHVYDCTAPSPGFKLSVRITSCREDQIVFDAGLALERRELTAASVRRVSIRYPLATLRVLTLIYLHGVGLRLAGASVFPHPVRSRG